MSESEESPKRRRRGAELEDAILRATVEELRDVGYDALTFDGVASRAGTSRAVLYRRWPAKSDLVAAGFQYRIRTAPTDVPDTGSLRGDIRALLRGINDHFEDAAGSALAHLTSYFHLKATLPEDVFPPTGAGTEILEEIERKAVLRGELYPGQLTTRMLRIPADLARQEIMDCLGPLSEQAVTEITDIFLRVVASTTSDQASDSAPTSES